MKNRLFVIGSVALAIGGVLLLSRLLHGKERILSYLQDDGGQKNLTESHPEFPESEFEGLDFLV